jgi:L-asparaginase/Glu-tRNA(Gln) amidotransferase subunit D
MNSLRPAFILATLAVAAGSVLSAEDRPKIAIFSGPSATIQNNKPLITSNKAREQYGLPQLKDADGKPRMDWPRYQRIAAPVTVYIQMFSAHPLEQQMAELYAAPDGFVNATGEFSKEKKHPADKPVYAVTLKPEDGLYALPYMGRQASGAPWEGVATGPGAPFSQARQTFVPDASRIFEEIERNGGEIYAKAEYDFYRGVPTGGYTKGLPAAERTDVGEGDIPPEKLGVDFFSYGPYAMSQTRPKLAQSANRVQKALASGKYAGALWLEGSPNIETSAYWLGLLVDTTLPITLNSAHRNRGAISADGDGNILNSIEYILSKIWAGEDGKNRLGAVMVQDEIIYSAREVVKGDAHPGGYVATEVRMTALPFQVEGLLRQDGVFKTAQVAIKDANGELIPSAIPKVAIVKGDNWYDDGLPDASTEKGILASIDMLLSKYPLAGIVGEGLSPYATLSKSQELALERAALCGLPVVKVSRGDAHGMANVNPNNLFIEGSNNIATKARLLLTAALMKYGSLPHAADPNKPTSAEISAIKEKIKLYQSIFQTH